MSSRVAVLSRRVVAALGLGLLIARGAPAQQRPALRDLSAGRTISSRVVAELSFRGLDVAPDLSARVFRLPGGGWGVTSGVFRGVVQRFDAQGRPDGTFGHFGHGPGEFAGEVFPVAMRDELWVVDPGNARISIFDRELHLAGTRRIELAPWFVTPARDGRSLVVSGSSQADGNFYELARLFRQPGRDAHGVPVGRGALSPSQWNVQRRRAAETSGGQVWAFAMSGGAVDVLDARDLRPIAQLQLPGREMAQEAPWQIANFDERPAPRLAGGVVADSAGLLWATFAVADHAWKPGTDPRDDISKYLDTRVLVIDPGKRAIVGQLQLDSVCLAVEGRLISCVDEMAQTIRIIALQPR